MRSRLVLLVALAGLLAVGAAPAGNSSAQSDRELLLELPQNVVNWGEFASANNLKGWLDASVPLCQWSGVQCDGNGRITALRLSCALCTVRMAGSLPGGLAGLDRLQTLVLSSNWLNSTLPPEFAAGFHMLEELHLDYNAFTGGLPAAWLATRGSLPALESLALEGNLLTSTLPDAAPGALQSLQSLGLQWNQLEGSIPSSWAQLRALKSVWLRPGNYQLCDGAPAGSRFMLCKELHDACLPQPSLGQVCNLGVPMALSLPPPTATVTMLQAVLRILGTGVAPFDDARRAVLASALQADLADVAAGDVAILTVSPVVAILVPGIAPGPALVLAPGAAAVAAAAGAALPSAPATGPSAASGPHSPRAAPSPVPHGGGQGAEGSLVPGGGARGHAREPRARRQPLPPGAQRRAAAVAARAEAANPPVHAQTLPDVSGGGRRLLALIEAALAAAPAAALGEYLAQGSALAPGGPDPNSIPAAAQDALPAFTPLSLLDTAADAASASSEPDGAGSLAPAGAWSALGAGDGAQVLGVDVVLQLHVHLRPRSDATGSALGSPAHPATAVSTVEHQLWQATSDGSALLAQLQAAGVPARRVLLISAEPLDPAALPPGSRYRVLAGALGVGAGPGAPLTLSPGALAAVVVTCVLLGLVLAVGIALLIQRRQRRLRDTPQAHASGVPTGALASAKRGCEGSAGAPGGGYGGGPVAGRPPARLLSTIGSMELLLSMGGNVSRWASGDLDAASERSASSTAVGPAPHSHASAFSIHCTPPRAPSARGAALSSLGPARATVAPLWLPAGAEHGSEPELGHAGPASNPHPYHYPTESRPGRLDRRASSAEWEAACVEGGPGAAGGVPGLNAGYGGTAVERGGSGVSTSGRMDSGSIELPVLPWSDWQIPAEEIRVCRRPNGAEWELGSGAFGKVFKAVRGGVQVVAVKVLHDMSEEQSSKFGHEIAVLKSCRHPNIVQFQGAAIPDGRLMLVTEYLARGDLWHALQRLPAEGGPGIFAWNRWGRRIALDIARGLCFLHGLGIVHFDLKSHNILLAADGTAKIADVGLARLLNQGYVSRLDDVTGTFSHAAPELLLGVRRVNEKADCFSYGVVLWEIATQERPLRGQLRDLRVPEEAPAEVAALMAECLDQNPKARPSAREIFERLSEAPAAPAQRAPEHLP
ncbi:hypothetical protein WJX81_002595 [Elliptochloris bilobata]|uniref:Protein kinase domain-containing protein n=1 Tax=Elliptochloris bilobata TaxID=381761 RepID=A0AAW1S1F0_9CHLO